MNRMMLWLAITAAVVASIMLFFATRHILLVLLLLGCHSLAAYWLFRPDPPKAARKVIGYSLFGVFISVAVFALGSRYSSDWFMILTGGIVSCDVSINLLNYRTELRGPAS
jgi:hypothetical protein